MVITEEENEVDAGIPVNCPSGLGNNLGDSLINPITLDLDLMEKERMATDSKQLEDRCKWLEDKFRVLEGASNHHRIDAKDLSLVPDLVFPHKFKMPEFEKYNETTCPEAHITMFCRRITRYVNNDQLLIHYFQDSLIGAAARWYNQLSRARISSSRDLAQAFMQQYNHVTDMMPDRITLLNMEKKPNESFRQYAQRWKEVAIQVQPPLLGKETTMLFINTLKAPFITHMIGSTTKSFADIVMAGEMIENVVRGGKIEGEVAKRSAPRRKDNKVNNMNSLNSRAVKIGQPKTEQQSTQRQESGTRQNSERIQFMPIPVTYCELYQSLYDAHAIAPFHLKSLQPPYPKWYDVNAKCEYHVGIPGHSIENCTGFKKVMERLIKMGVVKFDSTPNTENPLPDHGNQGVNAIDETREEKIKEEIAEMKTPMKVIWEEMAKRENERQETHRPRIIISLPRNNEVGAQTGPRVVIHKPNPFPYKDDKRVPWSYDCSVTVPEGESIASASRGVQNEGSHTRSGKRYDTGGVRVEPTKTKGVEVEKEKETEIPINELVKEEEAKEFLKFLKHSGYSVVEQLRKQPACISVLALLLSSEVHRDALLKDIIAAVNSMALYVEANEEAIECSFPSLEIINATFIFEGSEVSVPKMSRATRMALKMMMGKGELPGKGLGRQLQ
ncbi:uncharacterized protein [Gossypium hirsutum]|uniref:Retrotransposon gag domain-containing protein n=1 Tax=Gossypium hirsutum TaxID=3635 RepID=A0ABM2YVF7_GOSHI|nr:uncharacterized protein LOC121208029 [Gossypium hirsutum]